MLYICSYCKTIRILSKIRTYNIHHAYNGSTYLMIIVVCLHLYNICWQGVITVTIKIKNKRTKFIGRMAAFLQITSS